MADEVNNTAAFCEYCTRLIGDLSTALDNLGVTKVDVHDVYFMEATFTDEYDCDMCKRLGRNLSEH